MASANMAYRTLDFKKVISKRHSVPMHATLNIFSGRPNPAWILSGDNAKLLIEKIRSLPEAAAEPSQVQALGYTGIEIIAKDPLETDIASILLCSGFVTVRFANGQVLKLDGRKEKIEEWLLNSARPYLSDDILSIALHEIAASTSD